MTHALKPLPAIGRARWASTGPLRYACIWPKKYQAFSIAYALRARWTSCFHKIFLKSKKRSANARVVGQLSKNQSYEKFLAYPAHPACGSVRTFDLQPHGDHFDPTGSLPS
jgi:hypothetical protein